MPTHLWHAAAWNKLYGNLVQVEDVMDIKTIKQDDKVWQIRILCMTRVNTLSGKPILASAGTVFTLKEFKPATDVYTFTANIDGDEYLMKVTEQFLAATKGINWEYVDSAASTSTQKQLPPNNDGLTHCCRCGAPTVHENWGLAWHDICKQCKY